MGVGMDGQFNYTEDDVKECSRAFTGWTIANSIPGQPYGRYDARFVYNPDDHDDGLKTFLGETGRFNGEGIIDIIVKQPATARFLSRHLYSYFVADEPEVPSWMDTPPQDTETIKMLEDEYFRSEYNIRSMLRVLFKSDAFKNARFCKVKSPIETVIGTLRLIGDWTSPKPGFESIFDGNEAYGAGDFEPTFRRGLAYGQGMDRRWDPWYTALTSLPISWVTQLTLAYKRSSKGWLLKVLLSPRRHWWTVAFGCWDITNCPKRRAVCCLPKPRRGVELRHGQVGVCSASWPDAPDDCSYQGLSLCLTEAFGV